MPWYMKAEVGDRVNMDISPTIGMPLILSTFSCATLALVITMTLLKRYIATFVICFVNLWHSYLEVCANWKTERDDGETVTEVVLPVMLMSA